MEERRFKVNEGRIYAKRFYPYYITLDLKVNVVPISYFTRLQARFTLKKQFGNNWHKLLHIGSGKMILERGWNLGKNSVMVNGKHYQIKKFYIPDEFNYNFNRRRQFRRRMRRAIKDGKRSNINKFIKTYLIQSI